MGMLFLIPVPYGWQHYLYCPVCNASLKLSRSEKKEAKKLIEATEQVEKGEISEKQYESKLNHFEQQLGFTEL